MTLYFVPDGLTPPRALAGLLHVMDRTDLQQIQAFTTPFKNIGEDPEGEAVRPKSIGLMVIGIFTRFFHAKTHFGAMLRHSFGNVLAEDQKMVPKGLHQKMIIQSRVFLAGYLCLILASVMLQT